MKWTLFSQQLTRSVRYSVIPVDLPAHFPAWSPRIPTDTGKRRELSVLTFCDTSSITREGESRLLLPAILHTLLPTTVILYSECDNVANYSQKLVDRYHESQFGKKAVLNSIFSISRMNE